MKKILSFLLMFMLTISISVLYFGYAYADNPGVETDAREGADSSQSENIEKTDIDLNESIENADPNPGDSIEKEDADPGEKSGSTGDDRGESPENAAPNQERSVVDDESINNKNIDSDKGSFANPANQRLRAPQQNNVIQISSFEDLKANLEFKPITNTESNTGPAERFVLKGGNYDIVKSFEIDLQDAYFAGKEDSIKYGLISASDEISINGNNNTVSFKQDESVAIFGIISSPEYTIQNLKVSYPKDVAGFAFAQNLESQDKEKGTAVADGFIKNIEINVGGNVTPLRAIGKEKYSNYFSGEYMGLISAGFSWYIQNTNMEDININIAGNIGDTKRPSEPKDMAAAYGITHHFGNVPYTKTYNAETWRELFDKGNPAVLKDAGHIIGLHLRVGGNIQAYGHNTGYSAGVGQDMAAAWMEKINIDVSGDIITDLLGNGVSMGAPYSTPYAQGLSDEVMNLTDSSLRVNNIIFNAESLPEDSQLSLLGAMANNNSHGNYINIKNNIVTVEGQLKGKSNRDLLAAIGFNNDWNSNGGTDSNGNMISDGVDWLHENENNSYNIGQVNLEGDGTVAFNGLGKKWRTGQTPLGEYVLPEASLRSNKVKAGDVTITSKGSVSAALLMFNSSNAKDNVLDYGNIRINALITNFYGMGNIQNKQPTANFYENITENNRITVKDVDINTEDFQYISLMAGYQAPEQQLKNCVVRAGRVNVKLNGSRTGYIGGMAGYSSDLIDSCRVFVSSLKLENEGDKNIFFGLGIASKDGSPIKNSGVFVDGDLEVKSNALYGGGFIGFAENSDVENNDFQVNGKNDVDLNRGTYGGFVGWITESTFKNDSSLILNDFMPFAGYANGGQIENISHYVNGKAPQYFSGLIAGGKNSPVIRNSTLLVEKKFADTILYRSDSVSGESKNNYLLLVDGDSAYNRTAYKTAETESTKEEMGAEIPVIKKVGKPIGKVNIESREFQDKYWNEKITPYDIGKAEKNFAYMTKNKAGKISAFGVDSDKIVSNDGTTGKLYDYYHRHAGLVSGDGVVYDLLGIKGNANFRVTYDGNGADKGSVPIDKAKYKFKGQVNVLPNVNLSRTKYEFVCWNTKADGSGSNYKAKDSFNITEDTTLYAIWKEIPNTVTFKNGDDTYASVKVENGKTINDDNLKDQSMPQDPTKNGYKFKEWNTQKDGKGVKFTGDTVVNEDMTVYAIYSKNIIVMNEAPTLEVRDKTIEKGTEIDLMSLVVSASDKEDGDLTDEVKLIDDGGFDNNKVGKYIVTFKVTDRDGASVTKKATVTVIEKDKPVPKPDDNSNGKKPNTGDHTKIVLYGSLTGLSIMVLSAIRLRKRRDEK